MIGRNYVLEGMRRKTALRKGIEYGAAVSALAALGAGVYVGINGMKNESAAAEALVKGAPRIEVSAPADGVDRCFYAERVNHSEEMRNYFRKAAKEKGSTLIMPDLDRDGNGCNEPDKRVR